jgi:transcriptional regulator with XRE-family HTH domain
VAGNLDVGRVLKDLREAKGISVTSAAQQLGTARHATVSEIEAGRRRVSFDEMVTLAGLYGVTLSDLMGRIGGQQTPGRVAVALPRANGDIKEQDRLALARMERLAAEYESLKAVLDR